MKCPKCGAEMVREGHAGMVGQDIFEAWQCPICGYREEKKREKPAAPNF